jgi:hypothetical protein
MSPPIKPVHEFETVDASIFVDDYEDMPELVPIDFDLFVFEVEAPELVCECGLCFMTPIQDESPSS